MPVPRRRSPAASGRSGARATDSPDVLPAPAVLTPRLLRGWPLPQPAEHSDKEGRGRVLVVAGAPELPGTAVLSATAALRAGAGKLRIATVGSIAPFVGIAVPEARVY